MKKTFSIILLAFTVFSFAQEGSCFKEKKNQFTSEQRAILHTKQMTLQLDLNSSQQKQILVLNKIQAEARKKNKAKHKVIKGSGKKLSQDERFKIKNEILDKRLAHQIEIKKILNEKQFDKWQVSNVNMHKMRKRKMHQKGKDHKNRRRGDSN